MGRFSQGATGNYQQKIVILLQPKIGQRITANLNKFGDRVLRIV